MKEQTFRSREIEGGSGGGLWRNSLHMVAVHHCLVACCPDGQICWASGGCKKKKIKNHGPGKRISARSSSGGDGFQNRPGADVQTTQRLTLFTSLTLAPVDGFPLWSSMLKGANASKNMGTPEKMAFSAPGGIQAENTNCLCPKELVMHYQMKCFFLGKNVLKSELCKRRCLPRQTRIELLAKKEKHSRV